MTAEASAQRPEVDVAVLLAEISTLAASERLVRVLDRWVDPELVFTKVFDGDEHAAWLDAGFGARTGWSYLCGVGGGGYVLVADPSSASVRVEHTATSRGATFTGSVLDALDSVAIGGSAARDADALEIGFALGWVGWIGYESGSAALELSFASSDRPDSALLFVDRVIAFDHARRRIVLQSFGAADGAAQWLDATWIRLSALRGSDLVVPGTQTGERASASFRHAPDAYLSLIVECQAEIAEGEAYQLCLTNQMLVANDADPLSVFRRLRRLNPTPRGGLIVVNRLAIASSSPELFLRVSPTGRIETRPIKGTRPRGATARDDEMLRNELVRSEKERAENVMIVDLMRNDFSRVAKIGSVQVPELFEVERYANVFQLVSTVAAQLAPGITAVAALRSAFPAGSMTGAPKARAMTILSRLEAGPRGAYAGAFGFIGVNGRVELSMTIRTVVFDGMRGVASIGTGGGITALSKPQDEVKEMLLKAEPMLLALDARIHA